MANRIGKFMFNNVFKTSKIFQRPVTNLFLRKASTGNEPPIKPPGKEWVDQGWPDDGTGHGSYPNYAEFSYQNRDPNLEYFDNQDRRYFGEPLHVNDDILSMWMPDDTSDHLYSKWQMLSHLLICFGILGGLTFYSEFIYGAEDREARAPKPYPYNNLYLEMGGDPDKEPTEEQLKRRIPTPRYGW